MGVPYEIKPQANIPVAGTPVVVAVDWPDKSNISKIVVVQTDGVAETFTVGLYNHSQVMTGEETSDSEGPYVGEIPDDCYRVTHEIPSDSAGRLMYFSDHATGGYGFMFKSQESLPGRQGQSVRKLYIKITPSSNSAKRFALAIGGMKEVE